MSSLAEVVFKQQCLKTTSASEDEISHLLKVNSVNVLPVLICISLFHIAEDVSKTIIKIFLSKYRSSRLRMFYTIGIGGIKDFS